MRIRSLCLSGAVAIALALPSAAAAAEDPPYVPWSSLLPSLSDQYEPSSSNICVAGKPQCVDSVIREMTKRFNGLAATCDHSTMFALTYLRTTEEYQRASLTPGFFEDPNFVNHEDAVFASYYFKAFDAYQAGRMADVPAAWKIALDAAKSRQVTGVGDMLLGINAHINRDLPYVLAAIGLVKPDGSSRKPDHDKVNEFLNRVTDELYPELASRFDPTVDDGNLPGWLDDMASFQSFPAMREAAWRNAEALVNAPTPAARALVEQQIETTAATTALAIKAATAYPPLLGGDAARDAFCAKNNGV